MLWRHRDRDQLTRSEWILVYQNTSLREFSNKKSHQNPWKCSFQRATNVKFSMFHGAEITGYFALITSWIDSRTSIVKRCLIHCLWQRWQEQVMKWDSYEMLPILLYKNTSLTPWVNTSNTHILCTLLLAHNVLHSMMWCHDNTSGYFSWWRIN